mmetsp:Transcript_47674/g.138893  ORF Transcript_47674/g.138893 Transcript_47674/m.138893 type:complete len:204 (-) Transcript_47674:1177-1788(-)
MARRHRLRGPLPQELRRGPRAEGVPRRLLVRRPLCAWQVRGPRRVPRTGRHGVRGPLARKPDRRPRKQPAPRRHGDLRNVPGERRVRGGQKDLGLRLRLHRLLAQERHRPLGDVAVARRAMLHRRLSGQPLARAGHADVDVRRRRLLQVPGAVREQPVPGAGLPDMVFGRSLRRSVQRGPLPRRGRVQMAGRPRLLQGHVGEG